LERNHCATAITLEPVAFVRGGRSEPRDDGWDAEVARIELAVGFDAEALDGLETFSHVEIVFLFDHVDPARVERGSRHPRGNKEWPKVGIFAQRAKDRPNRLGVSVAKIVSREGKTLTVAGLDAVDGTPLLDIKPVMAEFLPRGEIRQPAWSREWMQRYWE
jgi:tRNA-Thr(GGU) m(6)t(6)A37 methyltransferase TsaA